MDFSKEGIAGRVGRMEQLAAIKRYAIEDGKGRGMRAFEVVNGSGAFFVRSPALISFTTNLAPLISFRTFVTSSSLLSSCFAAPMP